MAEVVNPQSLPSPTTAAPSTSNPLIFDQSVASPAAAGTDTTLDSLATAASMHQQQPKPVTGHTMGGMGAPESMHVPLDRFEAYVEDTLGSYAPSFGHSHHRYNHPSEPTSTSIFGSASGPAAAPLRPVDVDMASRSTLALEHQVTQTDSADMEYLRAKGAFDLPPRPVQEDLVTAFFEDVHPTAPVIDKAAFLSAFHENRQPSRLLLFAIFTSGSRACRNPALLDRDGTRQGSAQRFYRATKALLDTGYEQDRIVRVQALLLLTWWWDKKDDGGRNMRSCAVDAINTAQSLGMHRWDHYPSDNLALSRIWKRVWWTCFNRDAVIAAAHGLPCILSLSDFDVHPLTPEDFDEQNHLPVHLRRWQHTPAEVAFSIEVIKVAETLHHVHTAHFVALHLQPSLSTSISGRESYLRSLSHGGMDPSPPGISAARIGFPDYNDLSIQLCRQWMDTCPESVRYDVDDVRGHEFWPAFLHVLHFSNVMLRFREKAVARPTRGRAEAERLYCQARGIAAATLISKILRNARAHNHILRFTGQLTLSLFNCLVFFLIEGQSTRAETRRDAQSKFSQCLHVLYDFSQLWVSASLVHRLFEALQVHMQLQPLPPQAARSSSFSSWASSPMDRWHPLLPGLQLSSDVTIPYMKDLLETDFYYEDSSATASSNMVPSTGSVNTGYSSPAGVNDPFLMDDMSRPSPSLVVPLGAGMPDTLDVAQWYVFHPKF
ncbi:fungal-specific transcription factor domain-containing protein [Plectosphaerella plurivora]|uniref:Fungal-specific transcription factor domain-containing protein n=1 Tax=Plectosphaerella plurivora TaxID=936078 RepID=A0A9P9A6G1_9PEZI|nr:fungal-specific transcription factor domain-containing protein [Plectosphaerella plurivora]